MTILDLFLLNRVLYTFVFIFRFSSLTLLNRWERLDSSGLLFVLSHQVIRRYRAKLYISGMIAETVNNEREATILN